MNGCEFWCLVHALFNESLFELEGDFVHSGEDDESPAGLRHHVNVNLQPRHVCYIPTSGCFSPPDVAALLS